MGFTIYAVLATTNVTSCVRAVPMDRKVLTVAITAVFMRLFRCVHARGGGASQLLLVNLLTTVLYVTIRAASMCFIALVSKLFINTNVLVLLFIGVMETVGGIRSVRLGHRRDRVHGGRRRGRGVSLRVVRALSAAVRTGSTCAHNRSCQITRCTTLVTRRLN